MNAPKEGKARIIGPLRGPSEYPIQRSRLESERDQARQALNVSKARFETLFESNIVGIVIADIRGNITVANEAFLDLVGYTRSDLPIRWDKMTPPKWRAKDEEKIKDLMKTGSGAPWEKEYIARDGTHIPILVGAALLPGTDGDCVAFVQDLTESKRAESLLKQSVDQYRALYEQIPLIYFALSPDNVVLSINAFGAKELGYDKHELLGRSILALLYKEDRDAAREHLSSVNETDSFVRLEFRCVKKDGSVLWVNASARSVPTQNHESEVLLTCKDVTRRKEAEQRILEYQAQLRTLTSESFLAEERERRRIAVGLHDQVGQNLAMASMQLDGLAKSNVCDETIQHLEAIRGLIDRTIRTTRSLTFELSSPILYELGLEAALKHLAAQTAKETGVCYRFDTDKQSRSVSVDASVVLYRTVRELVHNVVKHARARSARIGVATLGDEMHIRVEDDGAGFEVLGSIDVGTTNEFGLFSIREHLDSIGGRLEIESEPGKGTCVVLTAPLERSEEN